MAYLGRDGVIQLQRSSPEPVVVPPSAINVAGNYVTVDYDDWFLADEVTLIHSGGVLTGYIHRDALDRIYLHTTRAGALSNDAATRRSFSGVSVSKPVVLVAGANANQLTTLGTFQATLTTLSVEKRLRGWSTTSATFASQATANPWNLQGQLRSWSLSRSAPEIETGSLGDKFTTHIKSVVSGSGEMDFIIDLYSKSNENDVDPLLRLVQLTEEGSTAKCKFYLKKTSSGTTCANQSPVVTPVSAALFFNATILLTASSIDVSPENFVIGSASFVTTGPIRLLSEA